MTMKVQRLWLTDEAGASGDRVEARCDFRCTKTGLIAGTVALRSPGPQWNSYRIELSGFSLTGNMQRSVESPSLELLREALLCGDARALWQFDRELAPFFCPECSLCYSASAWHAHYNSATSVDGVCPAGHRRRLCAD